VGDGDAVVVVLVVGKLATRTTLFFSVGLCGFRPGEPSQSPGHSFSPQLVCGRSTLKTSFPCPGAGCRLFRKRHT
jgi:hypothetical protein